MWYNLLHVPTGTVYKLLHVPTGTILLWGSNKYGQCGQPPPPLGPAGLPTPTRLGSTRDEVTRTAVKGQRSPGGEGQRSSGSEGQRSSGGEGQSPSKGEGPRSRGGEGQRSPGGEGCGLEKTEILRNVLSGWTHNVALTGKASAQLKGMAAAKTIFVDWMAHLVNSNYQNSFFK